MSKLHVPPSELDAFARRHLRYEVAKLVEFSRLLEERYPGGIPNDGFDDPYDDALLEAFLVHLRLLDEFLGSRGGHRCDARASDWAPSWEPERWLTDDDRTLINRKVAHLSLCRSGTRAWSIDDIARMTSACTKQLMSFVEAMSPTRREAFGEIEELVETSLRAEPVWPAGELRLPLAAKAAVFKCLSN